MKLNVLVIGSGGREDALSWKISQSNLLNKLFIIPGNPGTQRWGENISLSVNDFESIKNFCIENKIDVVVVGPENPLVNGIADYLNQSGIKVFGPSKLSAQIEGSKAFAKKVMFRRNVPTAVYREFNHNQLFEVREFLKYASNYPLVVKVDGLAAGKGVTICKNEKDALDVIDEIFVNKKFGSSGDKILIEEFLEGEEFSVFVITDGINFKILTPAQDYKRVGDNDTGKNTGGMGSYCFPELLTDDQIEEITQNIVVPVLAELRENYEKYVGCLYCGLIQNRDGIKVIEFNCRFGDPETQSVLMTIKSDFLELIWKTVNGQLEDYNLELSGKAVCLVLASKGYPDEFQKGFEVRGLDKIQTENEIMIFHAGTKLVNQKIITNGGRVLNIVAYSDVELFENLVGKVYHFANLIDFENKYFRTDIGLRGIKKLNQKD